MIGGSRSYEERRGLEVLRAAAQHFLVEIDNEHPLGELEVEPFSEDLGRRLVELIFGCFPAVEGDFRTIFEQKRVKAAGLDSGPDEHLPF